MFIFKFKKFFLVFFLLLFFPFFIFGEDVSQKEDKVYLIEIDDEIKVGTFRYLKRVIGEAENNQADYLIIKLDTPGGLVDSTRNIIDLFHSSDVEIVVFVHKEGGWAYSAGTFILLAADYAFVHPTASIGACEPQDLFGFSSEEENKAIEAMVSWIKGLAQRKGRNLEVAESFVRNNLTLTGKEAKERGEVIDGTAESLEDIFLKLNIISPQIIKVQPSLIENFFNLLSHPYLVSLFLTLGGLGLVFAFRTGEFEISGILGLILLLIGLWGIGIISFSVLGIVFLILGLVFLFLEMIEPGFGVFGILGIFALVFGIFTFENEPLLSPGLFDAVTMFVLGVIVAMAILFGIITRGVIISIKQKPKTGIESLIGLEAEVIKKIDPLGQVFLRGEIWQAKSITSQPILEKTKVIIVKTKGNTLFVKLKNDNNSI